MIYIVVLALLLEVVWEEGRRREALKSISVPFLFNQVNRQDVRVQGVGEGCGEGKGWFVVHSKEHKVVHAGEKHIFTLDEDARLGQSLGKHMHLETTKKLATGRETVSEGDGNRKKRQWGEESVHRHIFLRASADWELMMTEQQCVLNGDVISVFSLGKS